MRREKISALKNVFYYSLLSTEVLVMLVLHSVQDTAQWRKDDKFKGTLLSVEVK